MPRFRVRTRMVAVGVVALLLGPMGPVGRCYRRWSYHRSEAAMLGRWEQAERLNLTSEIRAASDRGKIRSNLMNGSGVHRPGCERAGADCRQYCRVPPAS